MASTNATHRLHIPLTNAPECGHRSRDSNRTCRRATGHTGRHAWFWKRADPGRVLEVWEDDQ